METSNYRRNAKNKNAVSIALWTPNWYFGRTYKQLAPPGDLIRRWKAKEMSVKNYILEYNFRVLSTLDPHKVYEELGVDAVLLCYESPGQFCHRRLVAEWLSNNLKINVQECKGITK